MGSQTPQRRRTLGNFLLNELDTKKTIGLEWIDRDKKLFRIPWMDRRNPVWPREVNILFKKWQIYTGKYEEGQPDKWTDWKQTFRQALSRSPFVEGVPEMDQKGDTSKPCKVFRFTSDIDICNPDSPSERKISKISPKSSPDDGQFMNKYYDTSDIPKVVLDELESKIIIDSNNTNHLEFAGFQAGPLNVPQSEPDAMDVDIRNDLLDSPCGPCKNSTYSAVMSPHNGENKFAALLQTPVERFTPSPFPYPNSDMMSHGTTDSLLVKFDVYYLNKSILEGTIDNNGVRFFARTKSNTIMNNLEMHNIHPDLLCKIQGPNYFQQVELPDVIPHNQVKKTDDVKDLQDVLENMQRGLLLFCMKKKLFAFRLCTARVFASLGKENFIIKRKNKAEHQLFSMETFESQLKLWKLDPENNVCPSPTVIVTFGREHIVGKKPLVHLELTVMEAEKMLGREKLCRRDIQISGFDSTDLLVNGFNQTLTFNNCLSHGIESL